MNPDDWKRVERIYHEALAIDPAARRAFLDRACAADAAVRREVESLLGFQSSAETFLERSALQETAESIGDGDSLPVAPRIAGYTIIELIGEGGMGVVYLAEQDAPLQRRVAVKLIKPGMDSRQIVERFETERQALARMDHPNIAAVFDAGTTDDGRPFFVMEFVPGVPITEYCDRQRLSTRDRLELFVQVCAAVQHAHQKGVIHRDLKPSNVLVIEQDAQPVPKVIDFGIAKATDQRTAERTQFTQHGLLVGTPEYMSPEQTDPTTADLDTRTDVYALGVVLYELLVGGLPFSPTRLREASYTELLRIIREEEPEKPSARLTSLGATATDVAARRRTKPPTLAQQLRGDLDWITLKALEKDRARRYGSASELAADLTRYLQDEPVIARPPSMRYRAAKFVRRNRLAVSAATVVAIAIVGGLVISTAMYFRADRSRRDAVARRAEADQMRAEADRQRAVAEHQAKLARAAERLAGERLAEAEYRGYAETIAAADLSLRVNGSTGVRDRLLAAPEPLRNWEWRYLVRAADSAALTIQFKPRISGEYSPNVLTVGADGRFIYLRGAREVFRLDAVRPDAASVLEARGRVLTVGTNGRAMVLRPSEPWAVDVVDVATGRVEQTIGPLGAAPLCAALDSKGAHAAIGFGGGIYALWDARAGSRPLRPATRDTVAASTRRVCAVAFSPDASRLASSENGVQIWETDTDTIVFEATDVAPPGGTGRGSVPSVFAPSVAFAPQGNLAALSRSDGTIALLDFASRPASPRVLTGFRHVGAAIVAFSPDGSRLVSAAGEMAVWDVPTGTLVTSAGTNANGIGISTDGRRIFSYYNAAGELSVWTLPFFGSMTTLPDRRSNPGILSVAVTNDGGRVVGVGAQGGLTVWSLRQERQVALWPPTGASERATASALGGSDRLVAVGYASGSGFTGPGRIVVRNLETGGVIWEKEAHSSAVATFAVGARGTLLASGSNDGYARIWDFATGRLVAEFSVPRPDGVFALAFRPDGLLYVGSGPMFFLPKNRTLRLWDWRTKKILAAVTVPWGDATTEGKVAALDVSRDGRLVAVGVGQSDSAVSLWDADLTHELGRLSGTGGGGEMQSVRFSPDGQRLLSAGVGGPMRMWDVDRRQLLLILPTGAWRPVFSPDGQRIMLAGGGSVRILESGLPRSLDRPRTVQIPVRSLANRTGSTASQPVETRTRPSFAGSWIRDTDVPSPTPTLPDRGTGAARGVLSLNLNLVIVQDDKTLTITQSGSSGGSTRSYKLDGSPTTIQSQIRGGVVEQVFWTSWDDDRLVITSDAVTGLRKIKLYFEGPWLVYETELATASAALKMYYRKRDK